MCRIALVAIGDPTSPLTWSGVPYNLLNELRRQGHDVMPLDISADFIWHWCGVAFNRILTRIYHPWRRLQFCNTKFAMRLSRRWLKRELSKIGKVDIVFSASLSIDLSDAPCAKIMLHDWIGGYGVSDFGTTPLSQNEKRAEENQIHLVKACDLVALLYPKSREYLVERCGREYANKIQYICNPVASSKPTEDYVRKRLLRSSSNDRNVHLLVVGGPWYQENVEYVIQAADSLQAPNITVDVVGRSSAKTQPKYCKVVFHGYLSKDSEDDYRLYESLFLGAKCLINIKRGWGGGSSIAEAMYKYVPVIIGRYGDIEAMYGEATGRFGFYCTPGDVNELADKLQLLLSMSSSEYVNLCKFAHEIVQNDTYEHLVKSILSHFDE